VDSCLQAVAAIYVEAVKSGLSGSDLSASLAILVPELGAQKCTVMVEFFEAETTIREAVNRRRMDVEHYHKVNGNNFLSF
jgi:hypothetical protein